MAHLSKHSFSIFFHLFMILFFMGLELVFFLSMQSAELSFSLLADPQLSEAIAQPLIILFLLNATLWFSCVFSLRFLYASPRILKKTTGTVTTETLIVLPIFLLFTSGLSQLAINEMAGLLTTVGAYEAGRVIAIWAPEIGHERFDGEEVKFDDVKEHARIAVAKIVTPVARHRLIDTKYLVNDKGEYEVCKTTPLFDKFAKGMESVGIDSQKDLAFGPQNSTWRYSNAFGESSFAARAPVKLKSAYCSIKISDETLSEIPTSGNVGKDFTITISYRHHPIFPLVKRIFGTSIITRSYTMRSHLSPNSMLPKF